MPPIPLAQACRRAAILLAPLVVLGGCGDARTPVPSLPSSSPHTLSYPAAGVSFSVPGTWTVASHQRPLISTANSGNGEVSLWRFPRTGRLPAGNQLTRATSALIGAARARDSKLRVLTARQVPLDGRRAIELDVLDLVGGERRQVRSLHLFAYGAELVLEELAPPNEFRAVDRAVFSPLIHSLRVFSPA